MFGPRDEELFAAIGALLLIGALIGAAIASLLHVGC